uniref:Uncharacterized protein n=1 Tax=Megaselia scalaris TaxID=36166 RepID=T1GDA1_MEGSC
MLQCSSKMNFGEFDGGAGQSQWMILIVGVENLEKSQKLTDTACYMGKGITSLLIEEHLVQEKQKR